MIASLEHICVCICTFKRPVTLKKLLEKLEHQRTDNLFTYSVAVADNDRTRSGESLVAEFAAKPSNSVVYCVEPEQNIAKVRNRALENSKGDFIAFIDDDEFPGEDWLLNLYNTCVAFKVDGVLGPVLPHFEHQPPVWAVRGGFFERPRYSTGFRINSSQARTGNVLFKREIISGIDFPFQIQFSTGSEDVDFFKRMMAAGKTFVWCDEAPVYELVTPQRTKRLYQIRLSLLRGGNSLKHRDHLLPNVMKAIIAIPVYSVVLPFLFLLGEHHFMKYVRKIFDHVGRLLALLNINPVKKRDL
jgi:succinoglycan biosynthesis protein ExoM